MERYPVLYGKSRRLRLRKRRIALFFLFLLLILFIGVGASTTSTLSRMTDRDRWAASLKKGAGEGGRENYLILLLEGDRNSRRLMALTFISRRDETHYSLVLPGKSARRSGESFEEKFQARGTSGVVDAFMALTGEPIHYYLALEGSLFENLKEIQKLRSGVPRPYYPVEAGAGLGQLVAEVAAWDRESLAFAKELIEETPFWRWPSLVKENLHLFETNLSWREISTLMKDTAEYSLPDQRQIHLPPGAWTGAAEGAPPIYEVDSQGLQAFLEYMRAGRTEILREDIRVEVLNGSGVAGLARRTARFLEEQGFQVVRVADADHFNYSYTQVISRLEDVTPAKEVAVLIRGAQLIRDVLPQTEVMVTVILGSDFDLDNITQ